MLLVLDRVFSPRKRYPRSLIKFCWMLPCSGLGVLSKRVDLRWNWRLEDLEQLTNLQDELLDAASLLVKPGGTLVYSTCSIDPEENEERVAAFLLKHPAKGSSPTQSNIILMDHLLPAWSNL